MYKHDLTVNPLTLKYEDAKQIMIQFKILLHKPNLHHLWNHQEWAAPGHRGGMELGRCAPPWQSSWRALPGQTGQKFSKIKLLKLLCTPT